MKQEQFDSYITYFNNQTNSNISLPWPYLKFLAEKKPEQSGDLTEIEKIIKDNSETIKKQSYQIAWLSEKVKELLKTVEELQLLVAPPPPPEPTPPAEPDEPVDPTEPTEPTEPTPKVERVKTKKIKLTL